MSEPPMPPASDPAGVPAPSAEPVVPASARSVTGEVILELRGVHTYYGKIHALQGIDLDVREGEIVTLIGSNGAGKTTTLHTISGLLKPRTGSISLMDKVISDKPAHTVAGMGVAHRVKAINLPYLVAVPLHDPKARPIVYDVRRLRLMEVSAEFARAQEGMADLNDDGIPF